MFSSHLYLKFLGLKFFSKFYDHKALSSKYRTLAKQGWFWIPVLSIVFPQLNSDRQTSLAVGDRNNI